jgi:hypothetical protein
VQGGACIAHWSGQQRLSRFCLTHCFTCNGTMSQSSQTVQAWWSSWKAAYGRSYSNSNQEAQALQNFITNMQQVSAPATPTAVAAVANSLLGVTRR